MPKFLASDFMIAICDRCRMKVPHKILRADGDSPGLRVCPECRDDMDPYRLPARQTETINIRNARPDSRVGPTPVGLSQTDQSFVLTDEQGNAIQIGEVQ